jgi:hypothetical protein
MGDFVWVKIHRVEFLNDEKKAIRLVEFCDMILEAEMIDNVAGAAGKTFNVLGKIGSDIVGLAYELLERKAACIVEGLARYLVENRFKVLDLAAFQGLEPGEDGILCRFKDTIETAKHRHGQHDILVLIGVIRSAQKIGNRPDETDFTIEIIHSDRFLKNKSPVLSLSKNRAVIIV